MQQTRYTTLNDSTTLANLIQLYPKGTYVRTFWLEAEKVKHIKLDGKTLINEKGEPYRPAMNELEKSDWICIDNAELPDYLKSPEGNITDYLP